MSRSGRAPLLLCASWALVFAACGGSSSPGNGTVALGAPCRGFAECAPVAGKVVRCDCTDQSHSPLCVADREAGESCAFTNFQPSCRAGTDCSGLLSAPVCVARVATGGACGGDTGLCQDPDYCDASGHCAPGQAKLGDPCDFPQDASCAAPNLCDLGTCVAPAALGQDCLPGDRNPCVDRFGVHQSQVRSSEARPRGLLLRRRVRVRRLLAGPVRERLSARHPLLQLRPPLGHD